MPGSAVLRITGSKQGFAQARSFTHRMLRHWALDHCSDDAATVVTELAANAVLHAAPHILADEPDVWLGLTPEPDHLVCAVTDRSDSPPVRPGASGSLEEHGRGLCIIDALSEEWGWTACSPEGKTVWARLSTCPHT
jgi:anti-sigma regulatory factor (Ser/Thr protein kinase)